jgi:hypothetical protein
VAWLFGRTAWAVYAAAFAFDVAILAARPDLMPRPRDAYLLLQAGAGPSLLLLFPFATALVAAMNAGTGWQPAVPGWPPGSASTTGCTSWCSRPT